MTTRNVLRDTFTGFTNMLGGEQSNYTDMLNEMQQTCLNRLVKAAKEQGANGLVGVRYATTNISGNMAELMAYGTAVKMAGRQASRIK